jgi:starch synthase
VFSDYTVEAFRDTVERALDTWQDRRVWDQLVKNGMSRDWSWEHSAERYVEVYQTAVARISGRRAEGRV